MKMRQMRQTQQIEQMMQIHFHTFNCVSWEFVTQLIVFYNMWPEFATNIAQILMKIDVFGAKFALLSLPLLAVRAEIEGREPVPSLLEAT